MAMDKLVAGSRMFWPRYDSMRDFWSRRWRRHGRASLAEASETQHCLKRFSMPKSVTGCVSHMQRSDVVAPHPDDETLGCGGTLLKHKAQGDEVHWVIATTMTKESGFSTDAIGKRQREINAVGNRFGFHSVHQLGFAAAQLDTIP